MRERLFVSFISLGIFLGLSFTPSPAAAEMPSKMFRLHLVSNVLDLGTSEASWDGGGDESHSGLEIGAGMSRYGVGIGWTLGRGFVLGGRVAIGLESNNWDPRWGDEYFLWSAIPYLEYVFLQTRVRPFVKVLAGFEGAHYDDNNDGGFWGALFGAGGGIHIFLLPNVSIDVDLELAFRLGTGHVDNGPNVDDDFSHWRFSFGTLFGLSAWL